MTDDETPESRSTIPGTDSMEGVAWVTSKSHAVLKKLI